MSELVKKSTEDIKDKLYDCLQSTFEEIEAVKHHLSCIYEGVANDLDILKANNEHYSETDELDGYGYGCTNKTCVERIRAKALDEFAERLKNKVQVKYGRASLTSQYVGMQVCDWCDEIAEQLKGGAE